ncbi:hypothetical protein TVAGG3_0239910 [Trichomonas vaginalis G3]|uniref:hypothetical protein n=1 Tax=Trichomonas vaginalis (strain ATCC PRA-98 / G3) TaxID=412133 RepID=UPI0021E5AD3D|nr:hypothetical protein TVAGG3_0239910 [Trichomonas vaginalis G3]KAI5553243.1 hypothetical protein TVAGG3_0239910 [Trichomonas vaginalis G3]
MLLPTSAQLAQVHLSKSPHLKSQTVLRGEYTLTSTVLGEKQHQVVFYKVCVYKVQGRHMFSKLLVLRKFI